MAESCRPGFCTPRDLDRQLLADFERIRIADQDVLDWFRAVLAAQNKDAQADDRARREELQRQTALLVAQQDRLLNLFLAGGIDEDAHAAKATQLRDRLAAVKLQLDVLDRSHDENAELACRVFELSQTLKERWLTADYATRRRLLEIVYLNCRLVDATLVGEMRRPPGANAEGPFLVFSRGERI